MLPTRTDFEPLSRDRAHVCTEIVLRDGEQGGGASGRIRTCGTWYRKPVLYPLSYGGMRAKQTATTPSDAP